MMKRLVQQTLHCFFQFSRSQVDICSEFGFDYRLTHIMFVSSDPLRRGVYCRHVYICTYCDCATSTFFVLISPLFPIWRIRYVVPERKQGIRLILWCGITISQNVVILGEWSFHTGKTTINLLVSYLSVLDSYYRNEGFRRFQFCQFGRRLSKTLHLCYGTPLQGFKKLYLNSMKRYTSSYSYIMI